MLIDGVLQALPSTLSYLFGQKINVKFTATEEEMKKMVEIMKDIFELQYRIKQLEKEKANPEKIMSFYLSKMDEVQHRINPEMPENEHFVGYYIEFFTDILKEPLYITFIKSTKYKQYNKLLKELLTKIISNGVGYKIVQFFKQIDYSGDPIIFAQALNIRLINDYKFLSKKRIRITKRTIIRYIKIYGELAGHFEKLILSVLGLVEILNKNEIPNYDELRRYGVAKKYWKIKNNPDYHELASSFNPVIRNSIAHSNFTFLPIEKKVRFMDLKGKIELTYEEIDNQVKELSSLVLALSQIKSIFTLIIYNHFKEFLEKV